MGDPTQVGRDFWVLHSPYRHSKSWRGLEKCLTFEGDGPLLFDSPEEALAYAVKNDCGPGFTPVKVMLVFPEVGAELP